MRVLELSAVALTIAGAAGAHSLAAQAPSPDSTLVAVIVTAFSTRAPLENAELRVDDEPVIRRSDYVGEINFKRKRNSPMRLRVVRTGFATLDTTIGIGNVDWIQVMLTLAPAAQPLPATTVAATMPARAPHLEGFERRRAQGRGRFVGPDEMREFTDRRVVDVLLRMPGVEIMTPTNGIPILVHKGGPTSFIDHGYRKNYNVIVRGDSLRAQDRPPVGARMNPDRETNEQQVALCEVAVFMDGMYVKSPDISMLRANGFAAVEYYTPSNTPVEFKRPGTQCGVVLLWSR